MHMRTQYRCKETGTMCYEEALHLEFWEGGFGLVLGARRMMCALAACRKSSHVSNRKRAWVGGCVVRWWLHSVVQHLSALSANSQQGRDPARLDSTSRLREADSDSGPTLTAAGTAKLGWRLEPMMRKDGQAGRDGERRRAQGCTVQACRRRRRAADGSAWLLSPRVRHGHGHGSRTRGASGTPAMQRVPL
jgi:hypothetical protein